MKIIAMIRQLCTLIACAGLQAYRPAARWYIGTLLMLIALAVSAVACGGDEEPTPPTVNRTVSLPSATMSPQDVAAASVDEAAVDDQAAVRATVTPAAVMTTTTISTATSIPVFLPSPISQPVMLTSTPIEISSEERITQLMAAMTLEEKVGQLFLVYFTGPTLSPALQTMIVDYHIGGIVLFQISDNVQSLPQVAELINAAQAASFSHGTGIPLLVAIDQEGGPVTRLPDTATHFPSNMAVGATGSVELAQQMATVTATELRALGVNMNLAPVVDVNDNPDNPVIGLRSFGSSPEVVAALGTAMIGAYRQNGIIATAKHFPGHGNTSVDSHFGLPVVAHDRAHLDAVELLPFRAAIEAGVDAIMTAHVLFPAMVQDSGLPATLAPTVLIGLLRNELGFSGLIVSDSLTMGALDQRYGVNLTTELAFRAGSDILAFGADYNHTPAEQQPAYQHLLAQIRQDVTLQAQLDDSARRILRIKLDYGLFDRQPADPTALISQIGTADHRAVARQIAQQSITLLKDERQQVPLLSNAPALLFLPPGTEVLESELLRCHPNLQSLYVGLDPTPAEIDLALARAAGVVTVIVTSNARSHPAQAQLVNVLIGNPIIVAAVQTPYDLMAFPQVPTYLASYGTTSASLQALAQVLCGEAQANGRLPVDLPGLYERGSNVH